MSAFRDYAWPSKQRTGQPSELHVYTVHWVNKSSSSMLSLALNTNKQCACIHDTCIRPQRSDTTHQTQGCTRHSTNDVSMLASVAIVGPTLKQYWVNACVCWEDCIIFLQICRNTMQSSHLPRRHKVVHHDHKSVSIL